MGWLKRLIDRLKPTDPPPAPSGPADPADPTVPPAPVPPKRVGLLGWASRVLAFLAVAAWVVKLALWLTGNGPAPGPLPDLPTNPPAVVEGFLPATGWVPDPAAVEKVVREQAIPAFGDTPAGKAAMGDQDAFLFRTVRKAGSVPATRYVNVNQRDVGYCVGCGFKHAVDVLLATLSLERGDEWKPVSPEAIYALSRVEIGGGKIRGDGSVGAWAADAVGKFGVLPMEQVGDYDLRQTEPARARAWGRTGLPNELEPVAKQHPVKQVARVTTWADVQRSVGQGYPVAVCSDQGFAMTRDADGFARPSGTWMHCMAIIAVRGGSRPGAYILNSWGDQAHTGGVYPDDMPVAGFWADPQTINRMVAQGDSFALSDAVGFPARRLPWFATGRPERRAFDADRPVFALAP